MLAWFQMELTRPAVWQPDKQDQTLEGTKKPVCKGKNGQMGKTARTLEVKGRCDMMRACAGCVEEQFDAG
jgi:hypothetical protein